MNFNVSKLEDMIAASRLASLLNREEEDKKLNRTLVRILACLGAVALVALISYTVYRLFFRDDLEDFDDDILFDDEDDPEDFFEEEDDEDDEDDEEAEEADAE